MTKNNSKYILIITSLIMILNQLAFTQDEKEIIKKAFNEFSKSPFESIYSFGGAFYSGDDLDQMPMLVNYYKNSDNKYLNVTDGFLGSLIMDANINRNQLTLDLPEYESPLKTDFNNFSLEVPIMRFPKIYVDILEYKFIDLSKKIISTNIKLGKNWHTLEIGYIDRVDTIVFSSSTYRVRSFSTTFMNNIINVQLGSYTNVNGLPYPKDFIIKSKTDNRELHYSVTNVTSGEDTKKYAKRLGW